MNCESGSMLTNIKQEEDSLLFVEVKCEQDIKTETNIDEEDHAYQHIKEEIQQSEDLATSSLNSKGIKHELMDDEIETTHNVHPSEVVTTVEYAEALRGCIHNNAERKVERTESDTNEEDSDDGGEVYTDNLHRGVSESELESRVDAKSYNSDNSQETHVNGHLFTPTNKKYSDCFPNETLLKYDVQLKSSEKSPIPQQSGTQECEKPFKCNQCSKSFTKKYHLTEHLFIHTGEKPFQCHICSKAFSNKSNLSQHIHTHTGEKPFRCNLCAKTFIKKSHLIEHSYTHTDDKPFKCNLCSKSFSRKTLLSQHSYTHTDDKPFKCNVCPKSFTQKFNLTQHLYTHTDDKPFKCNLCLKSFPNKFALNQHSYIHTGDKPFKCNVCSKLFSRKSQLSQHSYSHTNDKPFKCNVCTRSFIHKSILTHHLNTHL